jgi:hypothetical protein
MELLVRLVNGITKMAKISGFRRVLPLPAMQTQNYSRKSLIDFTQEVT